MDFLPYARKLLIDRLWKRFTGQLENAQYLEEDLREQGENPILDHLAIVDLPSQRSGLSTLEAIFEILGFVRRGNDRIADKANRFIWMAEADAEEKALGAALPQVVLADFELENLSAAVRQIVERLTERTSVAPISEIQVLADKAGQGDSAAALKLSDVVFAYLTRRDHQLPTREEFELVRKENELLAWVMIFGREVNHFGISAFAFKNFENLKAVNEYLESMLGLEISNRRGKTIRGNKELGIEQSSTISPNVVVELENGNVSLADRFIEFVWRHPQAGAAPKSPLWASYFSGFLAENAEKVIESLYQKLG